MHPPGLDRRAFLALAGGSLLGCAARPGAGAGSSEQSEESTRARGVRAVAFDGFPIFDPRPVFGRAQEVVGEAAPRFVALWRERLFSYQWLRALGGRYADFLSVNGDALGFAARRLGLSLSPAQVEHLQAGFLQLEVWPDAKPTLERLRAGGLQTAFLSNMTEAMLRAGIQAGGLEGLFDHVLSTDQIRSYKPAPAAYQLGAEAFGLRPSEVAFAAFAGWDAAGASWFGYQTVWVNRLGGPPESLGAEGVPSGPDLRVLLERVGLEAG